KPLPAEFQRPEPETPDEPVSTTIEASLSHTGSSFLLESHSAQKLKTLLEISGDMSKTLKLDSLLPKIVDSLFSLFKQADRGFVILRDEASKRLNPRVIKTRRAKDDETTARFSRHIVTLCMEKVQGLLSDDASRDERFSMSQSIADFRIRSVMCAPLWTQE